MGKSKLERFAEIGEFHNVFELTDFQDEDVVKPAGCWSRDIFQNENPLVLELACGKGAYTLELARRNPEKNFIGVDIKGARIWKGAKKALQEELDNVHFLRIYIDHLHDYFAEEEVDEIWITFPDPFPKGSDRDKRLTSDKFLSQYRKVMKNNGAIHLKTDSTHLFNYSLRNIQKFGGEIFEENRDVHSEAEISAPLNIITDFERKHLQRNRVIKYLKFRLSDRS